MIHARRRTAQQYSTAGKSLLTTLKRGSLANAAVVEHAACAAESASVSRKGSMSAEARQDMTAGEDCQADQGAETRPKAWQRGLWSIRTKNWWPSSIRRKWRMAELTDGLASSASIAACCCSWGHQCKSLVNLTLSKHFY